MIHCSISDSSQRTLFGPTRSGSGNRPSRIARYRALRLRPTTRSTSALVNSRSVVSRWVISVYPKRLPILRWQIFLAHHVRFSAHGDDVAGRAFHFDVPRLHIVPPLRRLRRGQLAPGPRLLLDSRRPFLPSALCGRLPGQPLADGGDNELVRPRGGLTASRSASTSAGILSLIGIRWLTAEVCTIRRTTSSVTHAAAPPSRRRRPRTTPTGPSTRGASRTGRTAHSSARRRNLRDAPAPSRRRRAARWYVRWPRS